MKKLYLLLLIVLAACNDIPNDFSIPKWDTDFNLPICSRFYYIDDMVKLDEDVSVDPIIICIFISPNKLMTEQVSLNLLITELILHTKT